MNPHDLDHTIIHHINSKAKELEDTLKSDVVSYFGQIHPQYFRLFRNFIERGFNSPVHSNLRASEGVKNLLR